MLGRTWDTEMIQSPKIWSSTSQIPGHRPGPPLTTMDSKKKLITDVVTFSKITLQSDKVAQKGNCCDHIHILPIAHKSQFGGDRHSCNPRTSQDLETWIGFHFCLNMERWDIYLKLSSKGKGLAEHSVFFAGRRKRPWLCMSRMGAGDTSTW